MNKIFIGLGLSGLAMVSTPNSWAGEKVRSEFRCTRVNQSPNGETRRLEVSVKPLAGGEQIHVLAREVFPSAFTDKDAVGTLVDEVFSWNENRFYYEAKSDAEGRWFHQGMRAFYDGATLRRVEDSLIRLGGKNSHSLECNLVP